MHRKKDTGDMGVNLGIIITPMLDMSFQILAFFIMTYHPSALEGHFDIKLLPPEKFATKSADPNQTTDIPVVDEEPKLNDVLLVTVKADKGNEEGGPSQILLTRPQDGGNANAATIADMSMEKSEYVDEAIKKFKDAKMARVLAYEKGLEKLSAALKEFLEDPSNSKANIKIEPDPDLKQGYTMMVYDACKLAGFQNIQFVGPFIERKKD